MPAIRPKTLGSPALRGYVTEIQQEASGTLADRVRNVCVVLATLSTSSACQAERVNPATQMPRCQSRRARRAHGAASSGRRRRAEAATSPNGGTSSFTSLEYAALAALWIWALGPLIGDRAWPVAAAIALAFAVSDEIHQSFVPAGSPTRSTSSWTRWGSGRRCSSPPTRGAGRPRAGPSRKERVGVRRLQAALEHRVKRLVVAGLGLEHGVLEVREGADVHGAERIAAQERPPGEHRLEQGHPAARPRDQVLDGRRIRVGLRELVVELVRRALPDLVEPLDEDAVRGPLGGRGREQRRIGRQRPRAARRSASSRSPPRRRSRRPARAPAPTAREAPRGPPGRGRPIRPRCPSTPAARATRSTLVE